MAKRAGVECINCGSAETFTHSSWFLGDHIRCLVCKRRFPRKMVMDKLADELEEVLENDECA